MNFADAISNQEARTENGMKAVNSTSNDCVDLFFKIGASRGKNIIPQFIAAFNENPDHALRIALWSRDIREGAGERQLFKNILSFLEEGYPVAAEQLMNKISFLGRWDDILIDYTNINLEAYALYLIGKALDNEDALCAKWMPRKGPWAIKIRKFKGWSPKQYRKTLVGLTNVVETQMCNKEWDKINFSNVPSLASSRYKTAFYRNAVEKFTDYVNKLSSGDKSVKVNAGAVYPYDIIHQVIKDGWGYGRKALSAIEKKHIIAQWEALPNTVQDANIFPMIDTSGSMFCPAGNSTSLTCMHVAVSLGLYLADKNTSEFKDCFLTFSESPKIQHTKGNIIEKVQQTIKARWGMNTDLHKAFDAILNMALKNDVDDKDMPKILLILSDMQFDRCVRFDDSALEMITRKYKHTGYELPKIVFWNINSSDNVPVKFDQNGTALVSGFSPNIMTAILEADMDKFTPEAIMLETINKERYNY